MRRSRERKKRSPLVSQQPLSVSPRRRYGVRSVCYEQYDDGNCIPCRSPKREECYRLFRAYKQTPDPVSELEGRLNYMEHCSMNCFDYGHVKRLEILLRQIDTSIGRDRYMQLLRRVQDIHANYEENGIDLLEVTTDDTEELLSLLNNFSILPNDYNTNDIRKYYEPFSQAMVKVYNNVQSIDSNDIRADYIFKIHLLLNKYENSAVRTLPTNLVSALNNLFYDLPYENQKEISRRLYGPERGNVNEAELPLHDELPLDEDEFDQLTVDLDALTITYGDQDDEKDENLFDEFVGIYALQRTKIIKFEKSLNNYYKLSNTVRPLLKKYKILSSRNSLLQITYFNTYDGTFSEVMDKLMDIAMDSIVQYLQLSHFGILIMQEVTEDEVDRIKARLIKSTVDFYGFIKDLYIVILITLHKYYATEYGINLLNDRLRSAVFAVSNLKFMIDRFPEKAVDLEAKYRSDLQSGKLYLADVLDVLKDMDQFLNPTIDDVLSILNTLMNLQLSLRKPAFDYYKNRADKFAEKFRQT